MVKVSWLADSSAQVPADYPLSPIVPLGTSVSSYPPQWCTPCCKKVASMLMVSGSRSSRCGPLYKHQYKYTIYVYIYIHIDMWVHRCSHVHKMFMYICIYRSLFAYLMYMYLYIYIPVTTRTVLSCARCHLVAEVQKSGRSWSGVVQIYFPDLYPGARPANSPCEQHCTKSVFHYTSVF